MIKMIQIIKCRYCEGYGVNYCENCGRRLIKEIENKLVTYQTPDSSGLVNLINSYSKKKDNNTLIKFFIITFIIILGFGILCIFLKSPGDNESFITVINGETGDSIELSQFQYNIFGTDHLEDFGDYMALFSGDNLSRLQVDDFQYYTSYNYIIIQITSNNFTDAWMILKFDEPNTINVMQIPDSSGYDVIPT